MAHASPPRESSSTLIPWVVILFGVLLVVALVRGRREYPDGTLVNQRRTVVLDDANPDLNEVLGDVVLGTTTIEALASRLGKPLATIREGDLAVWMFGQRARWVEERALFGLIPTGSSQSTSETVSPVGVKDGVVIHTVAKPSPDPATRAALEELWTRYVHPGGERSPPPKSQESGG